MEPLAYYFVLSIVLLSIGLFGLTSKRNAIRLLFSIEIILNGANLNFVAFARYMDPPLVSGQVIAMFSIALAAAEAAIGLAIILLMFRLIGSIDLKRASRLKG